MTDRQSTSESAEMVLVEFRGWDLAMVVAVDAVNASVGRQLASVLAGHITASDDGATLDVVPGGPTLSPEGTGAGMTLTIPFSTGTLTVDAPQKLDGCVGTVPVSLELVAGDSYVGVFMIATDATATSGMVVAAGGGDLGADGRIAGSLLGQAVAKALADGSFMVLYVATINPDSEGWLVPVSGIVGPLPADPGDYLVVSAMTSTSRPAPGSDLVDASVPADKANVLMAVAPAAVLTAAGPALADRLLGAAGALILDTDDLRLDGANFAGTLTDDSVPNAKSTYSIAVDAAEVALDDRLRLNVRYHQELPIGDWGAKVIVHGSALCAFGVATDGNAVWTTPDPSPATTHSVDPEGHNLGGSTEGDARNQTASYTQLLNKTVYLSQFDAQSELWALRPTARFDGGLVLEGPSS